MRGGDEIEVGDTLGGPREPTPRTDSSASLIVASLSVCACGSAHIGRQAPVAVTLTSVSRRRLSLGLSA